MDFKRLRDRLHEIESETWDTIRNAAKDGDAEAQYMIGSMYYFGQGKPKNLRKSAEWLIQPDHRTV